jgi:hypothetical protein
MHINNITMQALLILICAFSFTELEVLLGIVGRTATQLKRRLYLIYGQRTDDHGRRFSSLHETVLQLCQKSLSIFDQIRNVSSKKASRKRVDSGAACSFSGGPDGRITGMEMCHLLLLPFLLFDLLHDSVEVQNNQHGTNHVSPAQDLINWVLVLLE